MLLYEISQQLQAKTRFCRPNYNTGLKTLVFWVGIPMLRIILLITNP